MTNKITVTVSGCSGVGKTTVASHIQHYLKTIGFDVSLELTDKEMAPCPADLRKRTIGLLDLAPNAPKIEVIEKHTLRSKP